MPPKKRNVVSRNTQECKKLSEGTSKKVPGCDKDEEAKGKAGLKSDVKDPKVSLVATQGVALGCVKKSLIPRVRPKTSLPRRGSSPAKTKSSSEKVDGSDKDKAKSKEGSKSDVKDSKVSLVTIPGTALDGVQKCLAPKVLRETSLSRKGSSPVKMKSSSEKVDGSDKDKAKSKEGSKSDVKDSKVSLVTIPGTALDGVQKCLAPKVLRETSLSRKGSSPVKMKSSSEKVDGSDKDKAKSKEGSKSDVKDSKVSLVTTPGTALDGVEKCLAPKVLRETSLSRKGSSQVKMKSSSDKVDGSDKDEVISREGPKFDVKDSKVSLVTTPGTALDGVETCLAPKVPHETSLSRKGSSHVKTKDISEMVAEDDKDKKREAKLGSISGLQVPNVELVATQGKAIAGVKKSVIHRGLSNTPWREKVSSVFMTESFTGKVSNRGLPMRKTISRTLSASSSDGPSSTKPHQGLPSTRPKLWFPSAVPYQGLPFIRSKKSERCDLKYKSQKQQDRQQDTKSGQGSHERSGSGSKPGQAAGNSRKTS